MSPLSPLAPTERYLATAARLAPVADSSLTVHRLDGKHEREVLAFLATRPVHTVFMAGFIRDNGLESEFNRGSFYACRNGEGRLEGVALIGHTMLIEARTEAALAIIARFAQNNARPRIIVGEQEKVGRFSDYYLGSGNTPRRVCPYLLLEQRCPVGVHEAVHTLRPATLGDLSLFLPVQAEMAAAESGVNPLEVDPAGFRERLARRVEQNRIWVWIENERLIFKADVIADTPEAVYLEGIYVNPEERGKGYGLRSLSQLSRNLLARAPCACLLVNEQNQKALSLYQRAGYRLTSRYNTVYL